MDQQNQITNYRVKVGHAQVQVKGDSPEEAIRQARLKLSTNLPRLYDVIFQIQDHEFSVQEIP